MESAGILSSSSDDPEWRNINDRIKQISSFKSQLFSELRREHEIFKKSRDSSKPKVGITIRYEESPERVKLADEETVGHDAVNSLRDTYSSTAYPMLEIPRKKEEPISR